MRFLLPLLLPLLISCEPWRLERAARARCQEGLAVVQRVAAMNRGTMSVSDRGRTVAELKIALNLFRDGLASYAKAEEKTGKAYDVTAYLEGLKAARMMMMELKD
jgi:hypothetical protein